MTGIDRLISTSLSHVIKKKLNSDERKNIERKLFLEHGMSIKLSIEHFHKFDEILKKISSIDKKKFENECINEIIKIKKIDKNYSIKIIDQKLRDLILELCGDVETRKILICLFDNDLTIPQILRESKVPKTSGYRKIENLIINGLILESGKILSESKKISKYRCVFDEIKIEMGKNDIMIQAMINEKIFDESTSINITN
ncbi:MAG: transcriptional regulator [Nitrosarchaeum sp.]|nr:MAG: transcriptional regulator [Nitrosarchaeum sp.]